MLFKTEILKVSYTQNVYEIIFEFALINGISNDFLHCLSVKIVIL